MRLFGYGRSYDGWDGAIETISTCTNTVLFRFVLRWVFLLRRRQSGRSGPFQPVLAPERVNRTGAEPVKIRFAHDAL